VLSSQFFLDDKRLLGGADGKSNGTSRTAFLTACEAAERLAKERLATNPRDADLRPFAKILLALATLREGQSGLARAQLEDLVAEFPQNPLFACELATQRNSMVRGVPHD
jgi:predicted Zn-dependent protease